MSSLYSSVLIIGATSGIGRGLAQRIHASGIKVIACGRRQDRLDTLAKEYKGMSIHQFDLANIEKIDEQLDNIFKHHPDISTVIVNAGIQNYGTMKQGTDPLISKIQDEFNTNVIGPLAVSKYLVPRFLKDSDQKRSIIFVGSGLAFVPLPRFNSYCATKSALHSIVVSLRGDLAGTNIKIVELIPPFTTTELGDKHADQFMKDLGDHAKNLHPLPLNKLLDTAMEGFQIGIEEIAAGTAIPRLQAWRDAFQSYLTAAGSKG